MDDDPVSEDFISQIGHLENVISRLTTIIGVIKADKNFLEHEIECLKIIEKEKTDLLEENKLLSLRFEKDKHNSIECKNCETNKMKNKTHKQKIERVHSDHVKSLNGFKWIAKAKNTFQELGLTFIMFIWNVPSLFINIIVGFEKISSFLNSAFITYCMYINYY